MSREKKQSCGIFGTTLCVDKQKFYCYRFPKKEGPTAARTIRNIPRTTVGGRPSPTRMGAYSLIFTPAVIWKNEGLIVIVDRWLPLKMASMVVDVIWTVVDGDVTNRPG